MPEMAFFSSADPYNRTTTERSSISQSDENTSLISSTLELIYGKDKNCTPFSMNVSIVHTKTRRHNYLLHTSLPSDESAASHVPPKDTVRREK
jgi:hypothetical protein